MRNALSKLRLVVLCFPALLLTACGDELVGPKWTRGPRAQNGIEFFKDGTMVYTEQPIGQMGGQWRRLDGNRIAFTLSGLAGLMGQQICTVSFEDGRNTLVLAGCMGGGSTRFRRQN
jgi:hypothetical protein